MAYFAVAGEWHNEKTRNCRSKNQYSLVAQI